MYSVIVNYVYSNDMELVEVNGSKVLSYDELKDYLSGMVGVEKLLLVDESKEISVDELIEFGFEKCFELMFELVEDGYGYEEDLVRVFGYEGFDDVSGVVFKIERN